MNKQEVAIEMVLYKLDEISYVARRVVYNYAKYSGIAETHAWVDAMETLSQRIRIESSDEFVFNTPGLALRFSGIRQPTIPRIRNDQVIYEARAPRMFMDEKDADILPSQRNQIRKVSDEIVKEMTDVYGLRFESSPRALVFPKRQYSTRIDIFNATIVR